MRFAKQIVARGDPERRVGKNEQVLDINVSYSVPTPRFIQPGSQERKYRTEEGAGHGRGAARWGFLGVCVIGKRRWRLCPQKPPTERRGDVFLLSCIFQEAPRRVSPRCITLSQIALQRRAIFIFSRLENCSARDLDRVFIALSQCLRYFRGPGLLGQTAYFTFMPRSRIRSALAIAP